MKRFANIIVTIIALSSWGLLMGQEQNHEHFGQAGLDYLNTISKKVTETQTD